MSNEDKKESTSWRQMNPTDFLASWDFDAGQTAKLTISDWEITSPPSSPKKKGIALLFAGTEKKLFMNPTNSKVLQKATGSNKPSKWVGEKIMIYVQDGVRNPSGGDPVQGLRIQVVNEK